VVGESVELPATSPNATQETQAPAATPVSTSESTYLTRPVEEDVVYFMLPDRFANGDPSNDTGGFGGDRLTHGFDPTDKAFYLGGDLKGLTEKLDYIKGMGATAIWLGPIYKNKPVQGGPGQESSGYHGYWITDFKDVDPHLGTKDELKAFINGAHDRDMKVFLDIITNHTADVISYRECYDPDYTGPRKIEGNCDYRTIADYPFTTRGGPDGERINEGFLGLEDHNQTAENFAKLTNPNYAYTPYVPAGEENVKNPAWLNDLQYYQNRGETDWKSEASLYGDFAGLDDLMTEHPRVVEGMIEIFGDWISEYKVDGFRIDTTRHVNPQFWREFLPAMKARAESEGIPNFYMFGEVYDPDPGALARFTRVDGFDQVLDFGFQSAVFDVVSGKAPSERLDILLRADALYTDGHARTQPTFLGNHDMGRFSGMLRAENPGISQDELLARTRLGHGLLMFMRGVPVIYSGDEQGFVSDGNDQLARETLFPSQVAVYNDNNLIGTDATTADANFDTAHPLYAGIAEFSAIRAANRHFSHGKTVLRLSDHEGGPNAQDFAFSRFDPETGTEALVVANFSTQARDVNVIVDPLSTEFTSLLGSCPATAAAPGAISVRVPPLDLIVCRATTPSSRPFQ
jgi:glycosidase